MSSPIPREFVDEARAGVPGSLDRLVTAAWADAYRVAYAIVGERHGAEDAAQEACIVVYRSIAQLKSADAFRVWLYRIVVREASKIHRRRSRVDAPLRIEPVAIDQTARIDVWQALASLPAPLRDVVVLRYFEDLSSREIGAILRVPAATVRFRLMIAKRRLHPLLDDHAPLSGACINAVHTSRPSEVRTNAV